MEATQRQVLKGERVQVLETWLKTTDTKLTQVNGQRKYGGPPEGWEGPPPGPRCEVFISQLPRDTYEDRLLPLFSSVGPLWEFRLMMNFSGQNRGFAYAKYGSSMLAADAIRLLHGHLLEDGVRLSVRHSTEKRHVCIGALPAATRQEDLLQVLRALAEGVERVSLKSGPGIEGVSAMVAFSSHHAASMAKKMLVEAFKKQFALSISIKWQSAMKPSPYEPLPRMKSKSFLVSPNRPPRAPRHSHNPPQHLATPPPRLASHPTNPQGSFRAVGGGGAVVVPQHALLPCHASPEQQVATPTPVTLLQQMCAMAGLGAPLYEVFYSHAAPDGFLYFSFAVSIPGITNTFTGLVMVLAGPAAAALEEARQAAAQQVLQRVYSQS